MHSGWWQPEEIEEYQTVPFAGGAAAVKMLKWQLTRLVSFPLAASSLFVPKIDDSIDQPPAPTQRT